MNRLVVVRPGIATTIQDAGRPGLAHLGVSPGGAVDPALAGLLNRVVGNPVGTAVIETVGDLLVEAGAAVTVATSQHRAPHTLRAGERLVVPAGGGRQWHYVAVRGGLEVDEVLGSRSHDTLSGIGPPGVIGGSQLAVGPEPSTPVGDLTPVGPLPDVVRIEPGPRTDWFGDDVLRRLGAAALTVSSSSRVGVRLSGVTLQRTRHDELPSEGLVRGAIQVPPDGNPIMMLADHPTTGGYPVVAVVHPDDVAVVAQHPAGSRVRLRV